MRCVICDMTATGDSLSNLNDILYGPRQVPTAFYDDPSGKGYICSDCAETYIELMGDYFEDDIEDENND